MLGTAPKMRLLFVRTTGLFWLIAALLPLGAGAADQPCRCKDVTQRTTLDCKCNPAECLQSCPQGDSCVCVNDNACPCVSVSLTNQPGGASGPVGQVAAPALSIPIPTLQLTNATVKEEGGLKIIDIPWILQYFAGLYRWAVGIISVLAAVMMMIGGVQYMTAGGDSGKVAKSMDRITNAVTGLAVGLGSYLLLNAINPGLVSFGSLKIQKLESVSYVANETPEFLVDAPTPPPASSVVSSSGGSPAPGTPAKAGGGKVPMLKQYNYADVGFLNKNQPVCVTVGNKGNKPFTIKSSGCGVTSAAMVVAYYHRELDPKTLPPIMAQLATDNNMRPCNKDCSNCSGTSGSFFTSPSTMGKYGLKGKNIGGGSSVQSKAMELLSQGKPLVALMKGPSIFTCSGHYIVLSGVDSSGNVIVNDPGHNDGSTYTDDSCPPKPLKSGPTNIYPRSVPPQYVFTSKGGGGLSNLWLIEPSSN